MSPPVRPVSHAEIATLREAHVRAANCQLVRYSLLGRGLAYAVGVERDGEIVAYGVISTVDDEETLIEFGAQDDPLGYARQIIEATRVPIIEAQTNVPGSVEVLEHFGRNPQVEKILFHDSHDPELPNPGVTLRPRTPGDEIFEHSLEPVGDWVLERDGEVVATGGYFTHYNPPYADLYMEVSPNDRRRGYGSYLLQELKRVIRQRALVPAARCSPDNPASFRCTLRAGLVECGQILSARTCLSPDRNVTD